MQRALEGKASSGARTANDDSFVEAEEKPTPTTIATTNHSIIRHRHRKRQRRRNGPKRNHHEFDSTRSSARSATAGSVPSMATDTATISDSQHKMDMVCRLRVLILLLLICLTIAGGTLVYYYTTAEEEDELEYHYQVASDRVLSAISNNIDTTLGGTDALAVTMSNYAKQTNSKWPFVTMPNFYLLTKKYQASSKSVWTTVYHFVNASQRTEWEQYTANHSNWIDHDISVQEKDQTYLGPIVKEREDYNVIHDWSEYEKENAGQEGTDRLGPFYLPNWQSAPVIPYYPIYNWDLMSGVDTSGVNAALKTHESVLTQAYLLPDPDSTAEVEEAEVTADWFKDYIDPAQNPMEPVSDVYYPVFQDMDQVSSDPANNKNNQTLVALMGMSFYWRDVLKDILPEGSALDVVFENECNPTFTYRIVGSTVQYLGRGDHHDKAFNNLETTSYLKDLRDRSEQNSVYTGVPINKDYCPFEFRIYPNQIMEEQYKSNNPAIFTAVTTFVLAFTIVVFLWYDCKVGNRQRQTNWSLKDANQKLRHASALQLRHFSMMSHEIRTPLNCIVGISSLLLEGNDNSNLTPSQKESVQMIVSSGELLRAVVDDVLDYNKLEAGHQNVEISRTPLQDVLQTVLVSIDSRAREGGVALETDYSVTVPAFFDTDARRLQQILFNLLSNAIKFSPHGETVILGITALHQNDWKTHDDPGHVKGVPSPNMPSLRFYVKDHGPGIPPESQDQIFQPFQQATKHTERLYGGTGLGLSITKKLVDALGGSIHVESQVSAGSCFFVDFPLDEPQVVEKQQNDSDQVPPSSTIFAMNGAPIECGDTPMPLETLSKAKIHLVCQDQRTVAKAKTIFEHFGLVHGLHANMAEVKICSDGKHDRACCLLVDETLFDEVVYQSLTTTSEDGRPQRIQPSLCTFGPRHSVEKTHLHFGSINRMIPSELIMSMDRAMLSALEKPLAHSEQAIEQEGKADVDITALRVLVAEDNVVNQKVLKRVLSRIGVETVQIVDNGQEAVNAEIKEVFDVVLMDMQMPVMDGLQACRLIRSRSPLPHPPAPIVFLTANVSSDFRTQCMDAGAVDYLTKPVRMDDVADCLRNVACSVQID